MIVNHEEYTQELTADELKMVPIFVHCFAKYTKDNPIKSEKIIESYNENQWKNKSAAKLTGPRLRKICNYIRTSGQLPLIATSSGYYVSYDPTEIQQQIKSLEQRANSIAGCADGMRKWVRG